MLKGDFVGTYIVGAVVTCAVLIVIFKMIKDKKAGKSSCSCGCSECPAKCKKRK